MRFYCIFSLILVLLKFVSSADAQPSFGGQVQSSISASTLPDYSYLDAYNWARISTNGNLPQGEWTVDFDITHSYLSRVDSARIRIPSAYIDWYTDNADLRIGQQYISWSRADLAIVSDILSPVDLSQFLTRDFELIKQGITAVSYTRYQDRNFWQLVINPVFQPNTLPDSDSRWFPVRLFPDNFPIDFRPSDNKPSIYDIQMAARFGWRSNLNFDLDIGLYWWHNPNPAYRKEIDTQTVGQIQVPVGLRFTEKYDQTWMGSISGSFNWLDPFIIKIEALYKHRSYYDILPGQIQPNELGNITPALLTQFATYFQQENQGLLVKKPSLTWMIGAQRDIWDWTLSAQFIEERILLYDRQIIQSDTFQYLTLLVQKSFLRDKLQLLIQSRYHFLHNDFWIYPSASYDLMDNLKLEFGSHLFGGGPTPNVYGHLSFSDYRSNSLGYLRLEWFF